MVLREGCYMETHYIIQSNKFCWFWWSIIFHMRSHIDSMTRETDLISPEEQYFFILLTVSILSFSIFSVKTANRLILLKKSKKYRKKNRVFPLETLAFNFLCQKPFIWQSTTLQSYMIFTLSGILKSKTVDRKTKAKLSVQHEICQGL